jgi:hypothetical protein
MTKVFLLSIYGAMCYKERVKSHTLEIKGFLALTAPHQIVAITIG